MRTLARTGSLLALAALAAIGTAGCASSSASSRGKQVAIVAYSVPKPAYDALTAAFVATAAGKGVRFSASYGASGDQSRAVANGQHADYVAFSLQPDLTRLVPNLVAPGWDGGPTKGLVSDSVVVLAVRKGNPKHITGWDDLIGPGVRIVTPDPGSSGSAKWNLLAAYAHGLAGGGNDATAQAYLTKFAANIVSKPESGSKATQTFLAGTGDVLISYENEAISARQKGQPIDYVVPSDTVLIENPAAVTTKASPAAKAFLDYVESAAGQRILAGKGYRPVLAGVAAGTVSGANDPADPFPTPATLTTIAQLGGWSAANARYFDKQDGIITKILAGAG
ncbi:MAG TPA: extracellular solute-binding protein [Jatrophihabitans sp.]|nr:extracellular solute-binding protein [Jatrophihabitans sp.]